jgi:hypothetical protein
MSNLLVASHIAQGNGSRNLSVAHFRGDIFDRVIVQLGACDERAPLLHEGTQVGVVARSSERFARLGVESIDEGAVCAVVLYSACCDVRSSERRVATMRDVDRVISAT